MRFVLFLWALLPASLLAQAQDALYRAPTGNTPFVDGAMFSKPPTVVPPPVTGDPPPPKLWTGGFELGINGSEGNSQVFNFRLGNDLKRTTDENIFTSNISYLTTRQQDLVTANRALWNARDEVLLGGPWSIFGSSQLEYDELRAYDLRVGHYAGVGYQWWKTDSSLFKARVGAGAVRQFGGPDDKWIPEALLGFDYEHAFTDRQKFIMTMDAYPSLADFGQYRLRSRAAYEIVIDPELGLVLRLGLQNRYDTNPGPNTKRNDVDYFTALFLKF